MLTEIRDRSSGWFAWIIAAIIIIPMAFFGVQQYADTQARPTIVEIGDTKITQPEFQSRLTNEQNRRLAQNPDLASSGILNSDLFKKNILQSMIDRELVSYVADKRNYQVGDEAVNKAILENPTFQTDGKFDQSLYEIQMASRGRGGAQRYKTELRNGTRLAQVVSGYDESAFVLPNEIREILEIQAEKRTFDIVTINQADFTETVSVSEADISEYYESNIDQFMEPDRTSVSYLELDTAKIAEGIEVDDEVIQQNYEEYKAGFEADETRATRHILLSTNSGENENEQLAKAQDLVVQLKAGADFAKLAEENSQDPGSARQGGSLGDVERGEMVPEFDQAAFELEVGTISDPVKSQFGYHIIQVEKVNATEPDSLDVMRFELEEDERLRIAQDQVTEQAEQLRNLLFEQADNLDSAAQELGLSVSSSELFARDSGEGIASHNSVREAAFSDPVQSEGLNSELLEIADGVYVAVRKLKFAPAEPKELASVSEQIKLTLTSERAVAAAQQAGTSVLERAQQNWGVLVEDEKVEIANHTVSMIDTDRKVPVDVMQEIFRVQLEEQSTKVISVNGANGDFNVIRVTQIAPGDLTAVSPQVKDATRRLLEQRNGAALVDTYISSLSDELALEINEDLL